MASIFRKVLPREPVAIRAETWNALMDAAQASRSASQNVSVGIAGANTDTGVVIVRNDTGANLDRFAVVGLDAPVILPSDNEAHFQNVIALSAVEPEAAGSASDGHIGRFAVLLEPIANGRFGRAVASGIAVVRLLGDDALGFADIEAGNTDYLIAIESGTATIIWAQDTGSDSADGERWAIVHIGGGSAAATTFFPAIITGNATFTNRFKYAWSEAEYDGDSITTKSGGRSGTTTVDYALNRVEVNHTAQYQFGTDVDGADFPAGMAMRPVGGAGTTGTHKYDVPVLMEEVTDVNGDTRYWFQLLWTFDGECT